MTHAEARAGDGFKIVSLFKKKENKKGMFFYLNNLVESKCHCVMYSSNL